MTEITVSFRIRLPPSKNIQIKEVIEDEDEEQGVIEDTSNHFLPILHSNACQVDDESVSLSRSPELANVFHASENIRCVPGDESVIRHAGTTGEDIDTDSDSEYEYEEVTVTDDSEGEEVDEGEEFPYENSSCCEMTQNEQHILREAHDSSGTGSDECDSHVDVDQSDRKDEQLVKVIAESLAEVSEDGGECEQTMQHDATQQNWSQESGTRFDCQPESEMDEQKVVPCLNDSLDEEQENVDEDQFSECSAASHGSGSGDEAVVCDEEVLLEGAGCETGTGDDRQDVIYNQLVPIDVNSDIELESDDEDGDEEEAGKDTRDDRGVEPLPDNTDRSDIQDSHVVLFDHEIVRFVIKKSKKSVRITEITESNDSVEKTDEEEMEEIETLASPDPQQKRKETQASDVPVFTFKLRRSRTESVFEETRYDAEDDDEVCSTDDGSSVNTEHAFATSGEDEQDDEQEDEEDDEEAFATRKRVKRADSFAGNESLLSKVLVLLPFTDRVKCETVSKTWNSVIRDVNSNHQSSLGVIGLQTRNERLQNFCPLPSHRVDTIDCVMITSFFDIISVLKKVPNLKSLHIRCDGFVNVFQNVETSSQVGDYCPRLEHISVVDDISGSDIYDHMMPMISKLNELRHIQLRFPCKSSTMVRENVMIRKCLDRYRDNMEILSVNVPLHEDTCAYIANFCRLRKLSLHGTTIPMSGLVYLLERGNIRGKYIKCFNIVIDSKDQLQIITKNMVCLHSFHCVFSQFATKSLQPKDVQAIGRLKNLRTLFLSIWTNQLIDEGLIGIALGCRQLSSLTVNAEVSDQSVKYLGSFCPMLQRLELNTTIPDLITDASIDSLIQLKQLRYLTLYYCDISDEGIHKLLSGTKDLELLCISYSRRITCKTIDVMSKFAEEKPWERVSLVLPKSLSKSVSWMCHDIPRNLDVSFNS